MPHCHEMRKGEIYFCEECGLELQIVNEYKECGTSAEECGCESCTFECCGKELKLRR